MEEIKVLHKKKVLAPKLRFKDFDDEWKKDKLGEFVTINPSNKTLPDKFIYIDLESVDKGELLKENEIEKSEAPSRAQRLLKQNDILYQMVRPYQMNNLFFDRKGIYVASTGYAQIRTEECPKFIYQYLHFQKFVDKVIERCTGTSYPAINSTDLSNIPVSIPSLPEQEKIASFLSAVDEKIQLLHRKKQLLEQYKKGVMQQLFSGKLRFKDENGKTYPKWEDKKLGDISTFFSGGTPASTNRKYYSGTIPFIGSGNIYDSEVFSYITEDALNNSSAKMVEKGDLLYALYGANSGEVAISKIKGAINQAILCIRTKECTEYIYYVLLFNKDIIVSKFLQGGQGNLSASIIKGLKYKLPSKEEQKKIADFLSAIDVKIESLSEQINQTQNFKKGLLQQMFV